MSGNLIGALNLDLEMTQQPHSLSQFMNSVMLDIACSVNLQTPTRSHKAI